MEPDSQPETTSGNDETRREVYLRCTDMNERDDEVQKLTHGITAESAAAAIAWLERPRATVVEHLAAQELRQRFPNL